MKKAIVIGATSGIGKAVAQELQKQGYIVGITGRRLDFLENLKAQSPDSYVIKCFDNRETNLVPMMLNELTVELGWVDLVILSSGAGNQNPDLAYDIEKMTVDTNVVGFTVIVDWVYKYFEQQKYGHLAIISSVAGTRGNRFAPSYSASKAFQISYMEGLVQKAKNSKMPIYMTDIRPGYIDTAMGNGKGAFWIAPVDKTAEEIYKRVVLQKNSIVYVPKRWKYVAKLFRCIPNWIYNRL